MGKRFAIVIGVAAAGVMAAGAASVPALGGQTVKVDSKVTFAKTEPVLHGRVKSSKHACEVHRKVKLLKGRQGGTLVGKDRTNRRGKWTIVVRPQPGFYYVKALRREVRISGTTFVCRGDRKTIFP